MNKKDLAFTIYAALRYAQENGQKESAMKALMAWGYVSNYLKREAEAGDKDARKAYEEYCHTFDANGRG